MIWAIALLLLIGIAVTAAYKRRISTVRNANQGVNIIDDFLNCTSDGGTGINSIYLNSGALGTGAVTVSRPITPIYYPGAVMLYVQATNDMANIMTPGNYSLSGNQTLDIQTRFFLDNVAADSVENAFGFTDATTIRANETTGAMIYYNPAVSNNWVCYVRNASGLTQQITSVPANVTNTDTYLRIICTPTQTQFFVNAVLVATIAQSPNSGTSMSLGWTRHKISGSASSGIFVDAVTILQNFTTPRDFLNLPNGLA